MEQIDPVPHAGEVGVMDPGGYDGVLGYFEALRQRAPVYRDPAGNYILTRYEDVYAALRDPETFSSHHEMAESHIEEAKKRSIVYSDDPEHLGLRQMINRALTPRGVAEVAPAVVAIAVEVLAGLPVGEPFDVVPLGIELARKCFAAVVGLPHGDDERLKTWALTGSMFVRPKAMGVSGASNTPEEEAARQRALFDAGRADMRSFFEGLVSTHAAHDPEFCKHEGLPPLARSVVSAAKADAAALDELQGRLMPPLLAGGTSTVAHIFANVCDVLVDLPQEWGRLRMDRTSLDVTGPSEVIEEIMRLKSVVQGLPRVTTRDVELAGTVIPKGATVQLYYLSGSHDPIAFPEPEEFQARGISRHLGFGFGTHTCMGQSLVRLEIKAFLNEMLDRFVRIERGTGEVTWGGLGVYYTPDRFPLIGYKSGSESN